MVCEGCGTEALTKYCIDCAPEWMTAEGAFRYLLNHRGDCPDCFQANECPIGEAWARVFGHTLRRNAGAQRH